MEKYRAQLLADIEQHAKASKQQELSDREYVEQDFRNAVERCKLRDGSADYYVALMLAALHYGLRNDHGRYKKEIEKLVNEYDVEFLCKKHSSQLLVEISGKLDRRLLSLRDRMFEKKVPLLPIMMNLKNNFVILYRATAFVVHMAA